MQGSQKQRQQLSLRQKSWLATRALVLEQPITDFGVLMDRFAAESILAEKHAMASDDSWNGDLDGIPLPQTEDPTDVILEQLLDNDLIDSSLVECARFIISDLDLNGFFRKRVTTYAQTTGFTAGQVRQCLEALRSAEPAGLGATDTAHAFALQIARILPGLPVTACSRFLRRRERAITPGVLRACLRHNKVDYKPEDLERILASLDPAPLKRLSSSQTRTIAPDIIIQQDALTGNLSCVIPNAPWRLFIDPDAVSSARQDPEARKQVSLEVNRVQWINEAIAERTAMLQRLGDTLITLLGDYLSGRAEHPSRVPVAQLIQATGMSRTVMVRALQRKYVQTPRGTFRLRALVLDRWETTAAPAREALTRLLTQDPRARGFSDRQIAQILENQGIHISRRTVAKYRLMLGIPSRYFRDNQ